MKTLISRLTFLFIAACLILLPALTGCRPPQQFKADSQPGTSNRDFNFIFKYGVGAKNELDTFKGKYTKDMVTSPPATTELKLTDEEMNRIQQKMAEINFFSYPNTFSVDPRISDNLVQAEVTPYSSFYFKVQTGTQIQELYWDNKYITAKDAEADKLKELIRLIIGIVQSKPEYRALPEPRGGYM